MNQMRVLKQQIKNGSAALDEKRVAYHQSKDEFTKNKLRSMMPWLCAEAFTFAFLCARSGKIRTQLRNVGKKIAKMAFNNAYLLLPLVLGKATS